MKVINKYNLTKSNLLVPNSVIIGVLVFSTIAFSINTFDVFSVFYLIAQEFNQDLALLGLIAVTMTIGIGVFQIPGGLLAAKFGPKVVATLGSLIVGSSSILVAASTDISQVAAFRLLLGAGLAFSFPSAMSIITNHFKKGSEGLAVGTIAGAYAGGGMIGLVVWVVLAQEIGWRPSIAIGGILSLISALCIYLAIPRISITRDTVHSVMRHVSSLLSDKTLILLGILLLGSQVVFEQVLAFMPFYIQSALLIEPAVAGLVGSLTLIAALIGAPSTGWLYDRKIGFSKLVVLLGLGLFVGISINFVMSLYSAIISTLIVGFSGGGLFTLFSNAARERSIRMSGGQGLEYSTLSINWVHAIALTGVLWAPILFSSTALQHGYPIAWPLIGASSFVIMIATMAFGSSRLKLIKHGG